MFTVGLFALLAVAALALDSGHMLLNKGRLQNLVDASALHAAKTLQDGGSLFEARQSAIAILQQNLSHNENIELNNSIDFTGINYNLSQVTPQIEVEFSALPDPFTPILVEGSEYVRITIEQIGLNNFLAQILNFDKEVRASAVAGKSTDIECNNRLVPMMVCGIYAEPNFPVLIDPAKPFGLPTNELYVMKISSKQSSPIGPGNFQLLRLDGDKGSADLRRALAGEFTPNSCIEAGSTVPTEPGGSVGPVAQGLNTRFGDWGSAGMNSDDHPRDLNTCQGEEVKVDADANIIPPSSPDAPYRHSEYLAGTTNSCSAGNIVDLSDVTAAGERRELPVVIGVCDGLTNGSNTITALGTGCFFLTQEVKQKGIESYVIGEFVAECSGSGNASLDPNYESNSSTIVLYRDPDSPDS